MSSLWSHRADTNTAPGREPEPPSQLQKALTVKGVLDTADDIHIHGTVAGRVNAGRLVLEAGGCLEGDVVAGAAQIGGRLIGRVFALDVKLDSTANITGRVFHNTLSVASGARIEGRIPWRPLNFFEHLAQLPETQP